MKKILALGLLVAALGSQVGARADTQQGHITAGNPIGATYVAAAFAPDCSATDAIDGTDGQWFAVQASQNIAVTLTAGATGIEDLDVFFFDDACADVGSELANESPSEQGTVPAGATRALVSLYAGAEATFTVTLT